VLAWVKRATAMVAYLWLLVACHDEPARPPLDGEGQAGQVGIAGAGGASEPAGEDNAKALDFLREYAAAVCLMYRPCCLGEGLGYDGAACTRSLVEASLNQAARVFDPEAAEFCLVALADARARDPERCSNVASFEEATLRADCAAALRPAPRGGSRLGESCNIAADCANRSGERIDCFEGRCLRHRRGSLGDGPCVLSSTLLQNGAIEIFDCEARDGLFCHLAEDVCRAPFPVGQTCPYMGTCQAGAECLLGTCTRLPESGEACLTTIPGLCAVGNACDPANRTCGPPLAHGQQCLRSSECQSLSCRSEVCSKPDFVSKLSCTGDFSAGL
jgi:hypothetical protein